MLYTRTHEWRGNHSVWSHYSEEVEEGSRERKLGPALRILLIRIPSLRSLMSRTHNAQNLRIRPYSKYLKFGLGEPRIPAVRFDGEFQTATSKAPA